MMFLNDVSISPSLSLLRSLKISKQVFTNNNKYIAGHPTGVAELLGVGNKCCESGSDRRVKEKQKED